MSQDLRVASPPPKPLLVYDGECRFCCRWVARWQNATGDAIEYLPFQNESVSKTFPEIPREDFAQAVHLILPDGSVFDGAAAVYRSLSEAGQERWLLKLYRRFPGFAEISELIYDEIAEHRVFLSRLDRIYSGPGTRPLSYIRTRFLFLRGLALVYLIAFWSLAGQIQGLSGSHGIVPVSSIVQTYKGLADANHMWPVTRYLRVPTLAWWYDSDRALNWQCGAGLVLSLLLLFGIAPAPALFLLWILYLSMTTVCAPFLNYQWDTLLLETGLLAIFFAPRQWVERPSRQSEPSAVVVWLLRWLIFRLMLESGAVKLLSEDPTWQHLTALRVHYETQPLPTWIAWYAHQLPGGAQGFCAVVMFFIELVVPVFIFAGRRARIIAAGFFVLFQVLILLTGNYTFFNYLSILLCLPLLDDKFLRAPERSAIQPRLCPRWPRRIVLPYALVAVVMTFMGLLSSLRVPQRWPSPVIALFSWLHPFESFNHYGLFAVMTQKRPEIIVEGSADGKMWIPYEFKYKPGDLARRPRFVAPFQPRLDWQMWFAALESPRDNQWLVSFEARLMEKSRPVLALMGPDPFPKAPPKYIRAEYYEYRFTTPAERRATGHWWKREYQGHYFPPISISETQPPPGQK